jgi:hypothetical protein
MSTALEIAPSAAPRALVAPKLPIRSSAAKNDVAIFIRFTSFLVFTNGVGKANARPRQQRKSSFK